MDLEHAERDEDITMGASPEPTVTWSWEHWDDRNLPVEPEQLETAGDESQRLQDLRAFHLYGRRPADALAAGSGALPALLHRYRDLSRVRHEFPVCVNTSDYSVHTLTEWTDQFLAENAQEGDAGEQFKRTVYRLESVVRSLAAEKEGESLKVLWDRATATVLETSDARSGSDELFRDHVAIVRDAPAGNIRVIGCSPHAARTLFTTAAGAHWQERCTDWRDELDTLIHGLQDILSADFSQSDAARSPRHLEKSLGTEGDELDLNAMSDLLARAPRESVLAPERRGRIEKLVTTLARMQPVFDAHHDDEVPVRHDVVFEDCASALQEERTRSGLMTEFFRAVRIARLEIQNRYRADIHDGFFEGFDERYLTVDELALCPPILLHLSDEACAHAESGALLGILNATAAIKVLVDLRTLYKVDGSVAFPDVRLSGIARLASMVAALNHAYVLQAPLAHLQVLRTGLLAGLRHEGPALFCVYAPETAADPAGAPYLRAAAATESRFFPVLTFNPDAGGALADRVQVGDNPQPENAWSKSSFAFLRSGGEEASMEISFTPADYLFCDRRLSSLFWSIDSSRRHDNLVPVHEYLEMTTGQAAGRIPYIVTVDREGRIATAVVARPVIHAALQCRSFWRGLQETGGIGNSFAKRALESERERLAKDKERELEEIEKNYLAQLDQDVGELTREIVQRIAAQLMGAETISFSAAATPQTAPAPRAATTAPAAETATAPTAPAEPEEEEAVSFDEAYIDTPLCTSCNECTQLNNRIFIYNGNKQAEIKDASAGPFSDIVRAAELCPVHIIHPGKPKNDEPGLEEWVARAAKFN